MTVNQKLSRMVEAHEIAREKFTKHICEYHPSCIGKEYRLSIASFSTLSGEYAFSFWIEAKYGEINEVIRVKEGELK